MTLPQPTFEAQQASDVLVKMIRHRLEQLGGAMPFSQFMNMALYTPQYGYYAGGASKFGESGDFTTAPQLTPLFGRTLARQLAQLLPQTAGDVYEFGAGTGALAQQLLGELDDEVRRYFIVELSPELAQRQRQLLSPFGDRVQHLSQLPDEIDGIIIGNEVLDAMPVEIVKQTRANEWWRVCVAWHEGGFVFVDEPLNDVSLQAKAQQYFPPVDGYVSEIHPKQFALVQTLAQKLRRGGIIWLDYGFDAQQYYHVQRAQGTLMAHYRHHALTDPFQWVGLCDLTAHVNFTDIAQAGCEMGLDLIGYTTQAHFLFNLGITDLLAQEADVQSVAYVRSAQAVQMLTAQHEMGELFKVMALAKGVDVDWLGFERGDMCHKL